MLVQDGSLPIRFAAGVLSAGARARMTRFRRLLDDAHDHASAAEQRSLNLSAQPSTPPFR
jgi:hypothetical protein